MTRTQDGFPGGWKEDPEVDTLGRDIGVDGVSVRSDETGAKWVDKDREGKEQVGPGLSVL